MWPEIRRDAAHAGWILAIALMLPTPSRAAGARDCARLDLEAEYYGVPVGAACVVAGDWNEDGLPDLAAVNRDYMVTVLLNRGAFRVGPPSEVPLDIAPVWMAARDMDGDGHLDLVVTGDAGTLILAGDGKGGFRELERYPEPGSFVAAGDLDGDGRPDIVLARPGTPITIRYRGTGGVRTLTQVASSVALADFDHDGDLDLAASGVFEPNGAMIWLNDGHGHLVGPASYITPYCSQLAYVTTCDVNGDGNVDVYGMALDGSDICLELLLGHGDGTFEMASGVGLDQPATQPAPSTGLEDELGNASTPSAGSTSGPASPAHVRRSPVFIVAADFNGDGRDDLVDLGPEQGFELGRQRHGENYYYFSYQRSAHDASTGVAADMDGDGRLDMVVAGAGEIAIHPGNGDGSFRQNPVADTHTDPEDVKLADLDGDGRRDAAMKSVEGQVVVALTAPDGGYEQIIQDYALQPGGGPMEFADFDGDGRTDLLGSGGIFLGNGDGTFHHEPVAAPFGAPGDFNEDGRVDIAVPLGDRVQMMLGNGDGTFHPGTELATRVRWLHAADVDHDGHLDLEATADTESFVLYGRGDGTVAEVARVPTVGGIRSGTGWGDLNKDGALDVITTDALGSAAFLSHGRAFTRLALHGLPFGGFSVDSFGDLDGDGNADFMSGDGAAWFGRGDGTFARDEELYGPGGLAVLDDRNGDGLSDVVVAGRYDTDGYLNTLTLIPNRTVRNRPPITAGARASIGTAWPPNGRFADVAITGVTDPDGDPVTITCFGVTQDEPVTGGPGSRGPGDEHACADALLTAGGGAMVRAARNGSGNGRVYEISFNAADACGATSLGRVRVDVPHDQGKACVDDGQRYNSLACGATPAESVGENGSAPLAVERSPAGGLVIRYALKSAAEVSLEVFDLSGRRIARLDAGRREAGTHRSTWVPSVRNGVYFVRLTTDGRGRVTRYVALR